jgi:gas vesicle protein
MHLRSTSLIPILYEDALNHKYKKEKRTAKDAKDTKEEVKRIWRNLKSRVSNPRRRVKSRVAATSSRPVQDMSLPLWSLSIQNLKSKI